MPGYMICLLGDSCTRKTCTAITTLRPQDYPALVLDLDGKAAEEWRIKPFIADGRVKVVDVLEPLTEEPLPATKEAMTKPPTRQPEGWAKVASFVNLVERALGQKDGKVEGIRPATLIIDPLTLVFKYLEQFLCYGSAIATLADAPHGAAWKLFEKHITSFMIRFRALRQFCNLIGIAHIYDKTDRKTQEPEPGPMIDGQSRATFIGYWPNVFHCFVERDEGRVRTRGDGKQWIARTTLPIDLYEPANIAGILAKAEKAGSAQKEGGANAVQSK